MQWSACEWQIARFGGLRAVNDSAVFDGERDSQFFDAPPGAGGERSCQSFT
jgi:hypothetical protein